jgi:hypothetical protein
MAASVHFGAIAPTKPTCWPRPNQWMHAIDCVPLLCCAVRARYRSLHVLAISKVWVQPRPLCFAMRCNIEHETKAQRADQEKDDPAKATMQPHIHIDNASAVKRRPAQATAQEPGSLCNSTDTCLETVLAICLRSRGHICILFAYPLPFQSIKSRSSNRDMRQSYLQL